MNPKMNIPTARSPIARIRSRRSQIAGYIRHLSTFAFLGSVLFLVSRAEALVYTHTFSGTSSGWIGGNAFSEARFALISTFDDTAVFQPVTDVSAAPTLSAMISILGIGEASFSDPVMIALNKKNIPMVGLGDLNQDRAILFLESESLGTFTLGSAVAILSGSPAFNFGVSFATSAGRLEFSSVQDLSFRAEAIPDGASRVLVVIAIAAILFWRFVLGGSAQRRAEN
jgi:hypothetical protein